MENEKEKSSGSGKVIFIILAVVCGMGVFGCMVLGVILMPALAKAKQKANQARCMNNIKSIGIASIMYSNDYRFFPFTESGDPFELLIEKKFLDNREVLRCPAHESSDSGYEGFIRPINGASARSDTPLIWDKEPHEDGSRMVGFADGNAKPVDAETFEMMLKTQQKRRESWKASKKGK